HPPPPATSPLSLHDALPIFLVLDEPSTGLDPIVRRDILAAIIRTVAEEGRTVLFSSHLLDEVERMADWIAMIDRGRIVLCGPLRSEEHTSELQSRGHLVCRL